jgi:hypothetical protein
MGDQPGSMVLLLRPEGAGAQRDRDCAAEGVWTAAGLHRHNRVVNVSLADHRQ